jgi:hypothetical protein
MDKKGVIAENAQKKIYEFAKNAKKSLQIIIVY